MLNDNFSYTQVVSAFVLQEGFDIFLGPFFAFCLFLLQGDFDIFYVLFFWNLSLCFLYIKNIFISFLITLNFL